MTVQFKPTLTGLSATKRPVNRSVVNESMAASLGAGRKKVIALLPLLAAGSLTDADKITGLTLDTVAAQFGNIAYLAMKALFAENPTAEVDAIAVAEAAGTAGTQTITFATTADMDGVATAHLGDHDVPFDITDEDTADEIATACAAAIQADTYAPFSAEAVAAVVTCTYDCKGALGNNVTIEATMPTGIATTAVIATGVSGATDPTLSATYTDKYKMIDYDLLYCPWTDSDNVEVLELVAAFMRNGEQGRGALHIFGIRDSYSNALTWALARNKKDFAIINQLSSLPWLTPPHHRAAMEIGIVSAESNPSVPFQDEARANIRVGATWTRPTTYDTTIENSLNHGISIDDLDGNTSEMKLVRLISSKTTLATGVTSDAWESVHVFFVEKFIRQAVLAHLRTVYSSRESKKLVDGKIYDVKSQVISVLKRYCATPYEYLSLASLLTYKDDIYVSLQSGNPKRVEIGIPTPIIPEHLGTDVEFFVFTSGGN